MTWLKHCNHDLADVIHSTSYPANSFMLQERFPNVHIKLYIYKKNSECCRNVQNIQFLDIVLTFLLGYKNVIQNVISTFHSLII